MRYYNTERIRKTDSIYNFVIGERSNGKTTAVLRDIVDDYYRTGRKGAVVRQMEIDIQGHKGGSLFNGLEAGNMISELTDDEWSGVKYKNRAYYFTKRDPETNEVTASAEPFCYIFAISQSTHYKGNSYPNIGTIMFDEFMRMDSMYLQDEVFQFLNLVSTLVREKADAKIFMVANTVSWNSPYFTTMRLREVSKMKPGDLQVFDFNDGKYDVKIAVEYCENTADYGGKDSDVYFTFVNDDRVRMITDGTFAVPEYPKCPHSFRSRDILCTYWFQTDDKTIRGRLIHPARDQLFVFCETVHDEIFEAYADERRDLFYSRKFTGEINHFTDPLIPYSYPGCSYLVSALQASRMFFDNSETGENLMYFINQASGNTIMNLKS